MPEFDCGTSVYGNIEEEVPNDCQSHGERKSSSQLL